MTMGGSYSYNYNNNNTNNSNYNNPLANPWPAAASDPGPSHGQPMPITKISDC